MPTKALIGYILICDICGAVFIVQHLGDAEKFYWLVSEDKERAMCPVCRAGKESELRKFFEE